MGMATIPGQSLQPYVPEFAWDTQAIQVQLAHKIAVDK